MGVVSFRIPDEDEAALRRAGINPGALAKQFVEEKARRVALRATSDELARFSRAPSQPVERTIRELRESR